MIRMRVVLLLACAAAPLPPQSLNACCTHAIVPAPRASEPDRWLAMDKFWHFSASFVSVGAGYHLCANRLGWDHRPATAAATSGTFTIGIAKELYDLLGRERRFSWKDLVADAAGIGAGYLVFIHDWK